MLLQDIETKVIRILAVEDHYCACTKQCNAICFLYMSCHLESFSKIERNYFKVLNPAYDFYLILALRKRAAKSRWYENMWIFCNLWIIRLL